MNDRVAPRWLWLISILCVSLTQACEPRPTAIPMPATSSGNPAVATPSPSPVPPVVSSPMANTPTPTAAGLAVARVTVLAAKGNMFIRRGPDMAFNPIAVLRQGESATARARDVLGRWLEIDPAGNSLTGGWISIVSEFTVVSGDVRVLPEVVTSEWPDPASVRNCTRHEMIAEPGGIEIPSVFNFPYNDVRLNPGTYTIHDVDVDQYPQVLSVDLREGSAIDIRVDGNGEKRKCPLP